MACGEDFFPENDGFLINLLLKCPLTFLHTLVQIFHRDLLHQQNKRISLIKARKVSVEKDIPKKDVRKLPKRKITEAIFSK